MRLMDIIDAAGILGRLLGSGFSLSAAAEQMQEMQPQQRELWLKVQSASEQGEQLSVSLAGRWPAALVTAVSAGEEAGRLPETLLAIRDTCELEHRLTNTAKGLYGVAGLAGMGLAGLLLFLGVLIPTIVRNMGMEAQLADSPVVIASLFVESLWREHGAVTATVVLGAVGAIGTWLKRPESRDAMLSAALTVPGLGTSMRELYFGVWARYMALTCGAGIAMPAALGSTAAVLPVDLRRGISCMSAELARYRSPSEAIEPTAAGDARELIPRFIRNAVRTGENTGNYEAEFLIAFPALVDLGERRLIKFIKNARGVALLGSASVIVLPALLLFQVYGQMGSNLL